MSDEAVKLARAIESLPYPCTADQMIVLTRAVLAQHDELTKLRAALAKAAEDLSDCDRRGDWKEEVAALRALVAERDREIDRIAHGETIESDAMCINEVEVVNLRGEAEQLRAALGEALDMANASPSASRMLPQGVAFRNRIAELRKLVAP